MPAPTPPHGAAPSLSDFEAHMAKMLATGIIHALDDAYPTDVSEKTRAYIKDMVLNGAATVLYAMGQDRSQAASLYLAFLEDLVEPVEPELLPAYLELLPADDMPLAKARKFVAEHGNDRQGQTSSTEGDDGHAEE